VRQRRSPLDIPVDEVVARYQAGESLLSIAIDFDALPESIRWRLRKRGVQLRSRSHATPRKLKGELERRALASYAANDGETVAELAARYGVVQSTLQTHARRAGLRRNSGYRRRNADDRDQCAAG
jgi:hypothetical protein